MNTVMQDLYKKYGELMIRLEILQGQVSDCKRQIAEELNKPKTVIPPPSSQPEAKNPKEKVV